MASQKKVLRKFGKYLLLDRLAQGGMAEIFRAWTPSIDGGGRLMVLKCVQAAFGEEPEFIQMFRSEIRVTMGLNHPNIVQLYDFGEFEGRPFIAMELVDGKNLKQFITRVLQNGKFVSPEFAAHIISLTAAGLHYAHAFKDRATGTALNLVHRDISPQNLLLSYNGNIKIIDFGIAKVSTNLQNTRVGIIKGKPFYLSPEQIEGLPLDGRSDIFSLGAVLWETLTGKKLFSGDSDLAAIRMIENCDKSIVPASDINKLVPPELDAIIAKALSKDRDQRYSTAEEMQRALHRFVYSYKHDFDPADFSKYIQQLFSVEMEQEQSEIQALNMEAKDLFLDVEKAPAAESAVLAAEPAAKPKKTPTFTHLKLEGVQIEGATAEQIERLRTKPNPFDVSKKIKNPSSSSTSGITKFLLLVAALGGAAYYYGPQFFGESHSTARNSEEAVPQEKPRAKAPSVPGAVSLAQVKLAISPEGGPFQVFLNQQAADPTSLKIPFGAVTKVSIVKEGYKTFEEDLAPTAASPSVNLSVLLEPNVYGRLSLQTTPTASAQIRQGPMTWLQSTPITELKLPPGEYQVLLNNQMLGMKKNINLTIQAGERLSQDVTLDVIK